MQETETHEQVTSYEEIKNLPILITVAQAAAVGGWSEKHLRALLRKGEVKGCRMGQSWRINRDAFLAQCGLA